MHATQQPYGTQRRPSVVHAPDWRVNNPYQSLLARSLSAAGVDVVFSQYPSGYFKLAKLLRRHPGLAALHIHWINDLISPVLWTASPTVRRVKLLALAADLRLARAQGVRVVWTVHNLVAHESPNPEAEIQARRVLARTVSHAILHSDSARQAVQDSWRVDLARKSSVIPHGNYDGCYTEDPARTLDLARALDITARHTVVLFFGAIRPYKGVDRLLAALRRIDDPDLRVILAGRPLDTAIDRSLRAAAEDEPRLKLALGHLPDADVASYFALSHAVVLPFSRTLTSASAILALTLAKALILPAEAKLLDLADRRGAFYFHSEDELVDCLRQLDKAELARMGSYNRGLADALDWNRIGRATAELYRRSKPRRSSPRAA